jgi:outer membrane protein assembly factor BamB
MRPRRALIVPALALATVASSATAATAASKDWTQYHGSRNRHGVAASMPHYSGRHLHVVKQINLDGAVYASPLVVHGITIAATENNTVYAFNAHNHQVWKRHLGAPSPQSQRPCGDIDPLGITGTPIFHASNNTIYVAAERSGTRPTHRLYALSAGSGKVKWSRSLDRPGVDRAAMQERGALAIADGRVWTPFGGLAGDCGQYKGRVVGFRLDGKGKPRTFTVPTAREAGIWTPPGPTVDGKGHLYVSVGNGASGPGDRYDHSDSVLKVNGKAKRIDSFSPSTWATDNAADLDLGSQGPALVGKWVFIDGKSGTAYVLRRSHLGGIGGQVHKTSLCDSSFGGTAVEGSVVYVPCTDGVRAVRIGKKGRMQVKWHADSSITGSPVIGGGQVWTLDSGSGVLHALGRVSGHDHGSVSVGSVNRFATPALSGRRILVGTLAGLTVVKF